MTLVLAEVVKNTKNVAKIKRTEIANHEYIDEKLNSDFYFAHSYSSWKRGLNENTNGLIRQYIIKGTDFNLYSDGFIRLVQNKINKRPREKLF